MIGFFDIVYECNSHKFCGMCKYKETCYDKFQSCFEGIIPRGLWFSVT